MNNKKPLSALDRLSSLGGENSYNDTDKQNKEKINIKKKASKAVLSAYDILEGQTPSATDKDSQNQKEKASNEVVKVRKSANADTISPPVFKPKPKITQAETHSKRTINLPNELIATLDEFANDNNVSRGLVITEALEFFFKTVKLKS